MSNLHTNYQQLIEQFVTQQSLPPSYSDDAKKYLIPLAEQLLAAIEAEQPEAFILGVNGAQGSGKSTLAELLAILLRDSELSVAVLSIDDFYFSRVEREHLASTIHPLLSSRGVPGTHNIKLALETLSRLKSWNSKESVCLPRFNKAIDEPYEKSLWPVVTARPKLIILEGWFVGATPQSVNELANPINQLESDQDSDGRWRGYVNDRLGEDYQELFNQLNFLLMLKAPDFEQVYHWRENQERRLRQIKQESGDETSALMNREQLQHFIQHFQRLTLHCLKTLPQKANRVFELDQAQRIQSQL